MIGPTFTEELAAAGLSGLPFSWTADGVFIYGDAITPAQRAAIEAVYAAHDPTAELPSPPALSPVDRLREFLAANPDVAALLR